MVWFSLWVQVRYLPASTVGYLRVRLALEDTLYWLSDKHKKCFSKLALRYCQCHVLAAREVHYSSVVRPDNYVQTHGNTTQTQLELL